MRCGYLLGLITAVCMFGLGVGLQCYSCPAGSKHCEKLQECTGGLNSCLKLNTNVGTAFTKCISYSDCDSEKLAKTFPVVSPFTFHCCQTDLCNSSHSLTASPLIGLLAGVAVLWWAMH